MRVLEFDSDKYNFHKIIAGYIGTDDLTSLTAAYDPEKEIDEINDSIYKNMEETIPYTKLYAHLEAETGREFYAVYEQFIAEVIRPLYDEPIYYQKKPTHRIHFKDGSGASRFHKDIDYGHNRAEVNYSVPQTPMFGTNSIWIETEEDRADYEPMELEVGQLAEFKGAYLKHGAKENRSGQTRVSFDFRVMPQSAAPEVVTDRSSWDEKDKENPLFQNAHNFALCE